MMIYRIACAIVAIYGLRLMISGLRGLGVGQHENETTDKRTKSDD